MVEPTTGLDFNALLNTGIAAVIAYFAFKWITTELVNQIKETNRINQENNTKLIDKLDRILALYAETRIILENRPCLLKEKTNS